MQDLLDGKAVAAPVSAVRERPQLVVEQHVLGRGDLQNGHPVYHEWLRLFEADEEASIHQHPDFVLAESARFVDVDNRCRIIVCRHDRQVVSIAALFPVVQKRVHGGRLPLPVTLRGFRLSGGRFLGKASREVRQEQFELLTQFLKDERADFLVVDDLDCQSELWGMMWSSQKDFYFDVPRGVQAHIRIRFTESEDEYWSSLSRNSRKKLRRLKRENAELTWRSYESVSDVGDFLDAAHRVSQRSWQAGLLGVRVQNDERETELLTTMATEGVLRAYVLWDADRPVAFEINHQRNGYVWSEEAGFDIDYADRSPGKYLLMCVLEDLQSRHRIRCFDFLGGDAVYKQLFGNDFSESGTVWLIPRSLRGGIVVSLIRSIRWTSQMSRQVMARLGLMQRIRQLVRRRPLSGRQASSASDASCGSSRDEAYE